MDYRVRIVNTRYSKPYAVLIGRGLIHRLPSLLEKHAQLAPRRCMLVYQEPLASLSERIEESLTGMCSIDKHLLPDGERAKSLEAVLELVAELHRLNYSRRDIIIVLGGGAASDSAGFAAAVYKRGIPYVTIPTTLLSMVDAAIGGKVAVNYGGLKNLLGAFYQPSLVVEDIDVLSTLPWSEMMSGLGEVVKYAYTLSPLLHRLLHEHGASVARNQELLELIIGESVEAKARIVEMDEREEHGLREILNFGHTFGHALEASTGVKHGIAVAWGCVVEAWAGVRLGFTREKLAEELWRLVESMGFRRPELPRWEDIEARMRRDKKVYGDVIRAVFTVAPGRGLVVEVGLDDYVRAVEWAAGLVWGGGRGGY